MILLLALVITLQGHAQAHADYLAATGNFYHSDLTPLLEVCDWAGEVIYRGSHPDERWDAYAASPGHAAAVAHPRTHHGSGRAQMADGRWVVVDIFCVAATPTVDSPRLSPKSKSVAPRAPEVPVFVPVGSPPPFCSDTWEVLCLL